MGYDYPLDVGALVDRVKKRGAEFLEHLGMKGDERPDVALTRIVWGAGKGWFPAMADRSPHYAVDIGLPELPSDSLRGTKVKSIGDGTVVFVESGVCTEHGFDGGRVIVKHPAKGKEAYALYQNLDEVNPFDGQKIKQGDPIGTLGWHGDYPHLHFAVAAAEPLGDKDLAPEIQPGAFPEGEAVWNVLRVGSLELDPAEWPRVPSGKYWLVNGIEFVRWLRGEPYEHDIGQTPAVELVVEPAPVVDGLSPFAMSELVVESVFQSKALRANAALEKLACDPDFEPVGKGWSEAEGVRGLQRALATMYSMGKAGPKHDGIDGDWGNTTDRVLKTFQKEKLKSIDLSALGRKTKDASEDGKLDWLTLMGLDAAAAALESAPRTESAGKPEPDAGPPPERPKGEVVPLPSGSYVFDPAAGPSLKFGMLMYKQLLNWEWDGKSGVGYSTCVEAHYDQILKDGSLNPEWPDLTRFGIKADGSYPSTDGKSYPLIRAFGCNWKGTHFTNCCNSQMAALLMATGGKAFGIKGPDGVVTTWDCRNLGGDPVKLQTYDKKKSRWVPTTRKPLAIWEKLFVSSGSWKDENGTKLDDSDYGGMQDAMAYLGIGKKLWGRSQGKTAKGLVGMRVGDCASYSGHAWMVGDVRYGVFFKGAPDKNTWHAVVDQSGFIDAEKPKLYVVGKGDGKKKISPSSVAGRRLMNAADCDWVIANEKEFERRIQAFLAATELELDGVKRQVEIIEVSNWRVFSANGTKSTCHSKTYDGDEASGFTLAAKQNPANQGITRPWNYASCGTKPISIGRYYGSST